MNIPTQLNHPKVKQVIVTGMSDLSSVDVNELGKMDLVFNLNACSYKDAFKDEKICRKVDVDMASEFAQLAKKAGARAVGLIYLMYPPNSALFNWLPQSSNHGIEAFRDIDS